MCYPIPRQGFPGGSAGKESACNFVKFKNKIKLKKKKKCKQTNKKRISLQYGRSGDIKKQSHCFADKGSSNQS